MSTKTLIITEKPSAARAIAAALGANVRGDGCIHGGGLIVSWCCGHLVELAAPAAYDEKLAKWRRGGPAHRAGNVENRRAAGQIQAV